MYRIGRFNTVRAQIISVGLFIQNFNVNVRFSDFQTKYDEKQSYHLKPPQY